MREEEMSEPLYVRRASKGGNVKNLISVRVGMDAESTSSATGVSLLPSFQEIEEAGTESYVLTLGSVE